MGAPAFELDEYVEPEVKLQEAAATAFDRLIRLPAVHTAMAVGHIKLTGQQAARLHRIGVKRAWPDHIVLWPQHVIGFEWKTSDGELSRSRWVTSKGGRRRWVIGQKEMHPILRQAGMRVYVCKSVEQALLILKAHECPMLKWELAA